jgi:hypothetical protein
MAYIIDNDENRIQDLKDRIDQLEIQTFSPEVVGRNESTRHTGVQAGVSNPYPLWKPMQILGDIGDLSQAVFLDRPDAHGAKMTLIGDIDIGFEKPPPSKRKVEFTLDITQDAVGGHIVNFGILAIQPTPIVGIGANERTIINLQTTDGGVTYQVTSQIPPLVVSTEPTTIAEADTAFGTGIGTIGVWDNGSNKLVMFIKQINGNWSSSDFKYNELTS